ncbi:unnamed protein product [Tuber melanosporum]|uniref:TBP-associated factor 12 n=1 Tax=Tuber melanosporum (strain Mel28) TaxID=656061 RepID=D5GN25_TUBMM|nr:uncharacterized protein GSTUM_00011058001 [Tuber melanosporum]CAZ85918.1 unnamed protein product [Tuber melanosporum]
MSTVDGSERKRKPVDLNLENSPPSKQVKIEGGTMSAGPPSNLLPRQALQHLVSLQPSMSDEQKTKYMTGLDRLRSLVEKSGLGTTEGQAAQVQYDQIVNRLKISLRQQQAQQKQREAQQQQQAQQQQVQQQQTQQQQNYSTPAGSSLAGIAGGNGTMISGGTSVGSVVGAGPVTSGAPAAPSISQRQTWIVPAGVAPQNADAWRAEIYGKLSQVGQKMTQAKAQITALHQSLQRPNLTPDEQVGIQQKITEVTQNFNGWRDVLNKFTAQQKMLQQQQQQQQQQRMRASQQQGQVSMVGGGQMQKPAPQGMVPDIQQGQQGMINVGAPQQQTNPNNTQGNPPNLHQQPAQQPNQMQQHTQPHTQPQTQQQQHQSTPAQRIATPIQRADSPPGPSNNVAGINQNRVSVGRQTMSPAAQQQPPMQQQPQQVMGQTSTTQQQAVTQQPPQQATQQVSTAAQRGLHQQVQQPGAAAGRSPAPGPTGPPGTPMAQPNSPAPRPGSVQPAARPPTATGTPVAQQQPQAQQAHRIQPASSASAASPTTSAHPSQTTRDTSQQHTFHIPPNLALAAPQPIAVPAARPTLSGGMNSSGNQMMSTPAITKQPAFEFDEGGMGLLSKRKLEELVKQIDPEERLDPDVEEAILELVDEFIDSIATSACKMAKLRGSDTLDLKDVQIILERNWNIRIPGYAADEIRTVRKFHPAPGYHHKMAALAAQKQLAQTSGKGGE